MHRRHFDRFIAAGLLTLLLVSQAFAQPPQQPRRLAPGILTEIPSAAQPRETFTGPLPLKHLPTIDFKPNYSSKEQTLFEKSKLITEWTEITSGVARPASSSAVARWAFHWPEVPCHPRASTA